MTPQQRNVAAAITHVRHTLDGGDGTVVFVTGRPAVIAVEPDGSVAGWTVAHDWTGDRAGSQRVYAVPTHFDLAARHGAPIAELCVMRTDAEPRWRVVAVTQARSAVLCSEQYDAPDALALGLTALLGAQVPDRDGTPGPGLRHGDMR